MDARTSAIFAFSTGYYLFGHIWSKKIKIASLSWNLIPRLIRICGTQWWCLFCLFLDWKYPFWTNLVQKVKIVSLSWNLRISSNSNMQNSMALFTFSVSDRIHPSWASLVQKIKIVSLSWNSVPRLIRIYKIQWWCSLFYRKHPFGK